MENVKEQYEKLARWSFNSKETYLAWVMDWKGYYRDLSIFIREARAQFRESQRSGAETNWREIYSLNIARHYATCALRLRRNCKKEAAYQVMIVMTHEESNDDAIRDAQISDVSAALIENKG